MIQAVTPVTNTATSVPTTATPAPSTAPVTDATTSVTTETPSSTPAPATEAPKTVTTDLDANEVKQWAQLTRANREAKAKIASLEAEYAEFKAKAETKPTIASLKAAREAGLPLDDLVIEYLSESMAEPTEPPSKEMLAMKAEIERLAAKDAEAEKARKDAEEQAVKTTQEQARASVVTFITDEIKKDSESGAPKWPRVAREPEAVAEALSMVKEAQIAFVKKHGTNYDDAQALAVFHAAFDELESHYKELGARYAINENPPPSRGDRGTTRVTDPVASRKPVTIDNNRGSVRKPTQSAPTYQTFKEIKAELMAKRTAR